MNDEDMYKICLEGGRRFSATTVGGAGFDTQLFLFNSAGRGVYANDDTTLDILQSTLPAKHPLTPRRSGSYYLAISSYDNDPVSSRGAIFPDEPFDAVHGPTGPGGGSPVSNWDDEGLESGAYTITLRGAEFLEEDEERRGGRAESEDCD